MFASSRSSSSTTGKDPSEQDKVTREWDALAGEWDDLAAGYAEALFPRLQAMIEDQWPHHSTPQNTSNNNNGNHAVLRIVDFGCGTGLLTEKLRAVSAKVLAIDASHSMIRVVKEKIRNCEWDNVQAVAVTLGEEWHHPCDAIIPTTTTSLSSQQQQQQQILAEWEGTADLVIASNVMAFIPQADWPVTMQRISRLLKMPSSAGGKAFFWHSDWTATTENESKDSRPPALEEKPASTTTTTTAVFASFSSSGQKMNPDLATELYASSGGDLRAESMQVVVDMASAANHTNNSHGPVFLGLAQKYQL